MRKYDYRPLAFSHQPVQLISGNPRHAQAAVEATSLPPLDRDVSRKQRPDQADGNGAELLQAYHEATNFVMEEHPRTDGDADPDRCAQAVQQREGPQPESRRAGQRRHDHG